MEFKENQQSKKDAYQCGRIYAVYEVLRKKASGEDFSSGVFLNVTQNPLATLIRLSCISRNDLARLKDKNIRTYYKKMLSELHGDITTIPTKFNLVEQGEFLAGYHKQRHNMMNS